MKLSSAIIWKKLNT